jgi:hypothetical protein
MAQYLEEQASDEYYSNWYAEEAQWVKDEQAFLRQAAQNEALYPMEKFAQELEQASDLRALKSFVSYHNKRDDKWRKDDEEARLN